jgi:hypothetical protein
MTPSSCPVFGEHRWHPVGDYEMCRCGEYRELEHKPKKVNHSFVEGIAVNSEITAVRWEKV